MPLLGLIGNPVKHSKSPDIFTSFFEKENLDNYKYQLFQLNKIQNLNALISSHPELVGFNVTIPYKQQIISHLSTASEEVSELNSCNTVIIKRKGKLWQLHGHNTDIYGFSHIMYQLNLKPNNLPKALILGTGGSAASVAYVLESFDIEYKFVSRQVAKTVLNFEEITPEIIESHQLIINTTPLGMHPNLDQSPDIPYEAITKNHNCIDLIYNPEKTEFMTKCESQGATTFGGWLMLIKQAEKSWELFKRNIQE